MQDLENSLAAQAPPQVQDNPSLHELPALSLDGIPTPVNKMTQVSKAYTTADLIFSCCYCEH